MAVPNIGSNTLTPAVGVTGSPLYPGMVGVDGTTKRPYTLAQMDSDAALSLDAINTDLAVSATLQDCFASSVADVIYTGKGKVTVPDSIVMRIDAAPTGAKTVTMPIKDPIRGLPRAGTGEKQAGYEVGQKVRYITAHYNEYSQAIATETWGVNFNDVDKFGLYREANPDLAKYFEEVTGRQYREASLETVTYELTKAGSDLTKNWNPNVFVANIDPWSQPAYDADVATYTNNIITAMQIADTGTNGVNANLSIQFLDAVLNYARVSKRIKPISTSAGNGYLLVLPSNAMSSISSAVGELGNLWRDVTSLTKEAIEYPGLVGMYKQLLIVEDDRNPTLTATYTDATSGLLAPSYVQPGNDDLRNLEVYNTATNPTWSVGGLYGQAAFCDWTVRALHWEDQIEEYGKEKGIGGFTERGVELALVRSDTLAVNTENQSSIALFFTNNTILTTL